MMRPSSPDSNGGSPRNMISPPNMFTMAQPVVRTTTLTAPLPQMVSRSPGYSSNSYSHSTSPSTASGSLSEIHSQDGPNMIISPTHILSATLNAQKRAYRQRRKDPSCDACRERKVKCDATETSACSECSTRNHKCQFTKETNRRMSSIKQVQDLQSQVAELTQMNSQLRTQSTNKDILDTERTDMKRRFSEAPNGTIPKSHRPPLPVLNNFDHVRINVRRYAEGLFNVPHVGRGFHIARVSYLPTLPSEAEFVHLFHSYCESIQDWYPVLHRPTFQQEVDEVYSRRSFEGVTRQWIGLFFAVLACGSLQAGVRPTSSSSATSRDSTYLDIATQALTPWSSDLTITHAQAALLLSIYSAESNSKVVGSMWLASAVRVAQELRICVESESWSAFDDESRRRLWWAIFVRDRITSIETNRPMLIHEDDCEIALPSPIEDRYNQPDGFFHSQGSRETLTGSVAVVHITRVYTQLHRTLRSGVIPALALHEIDERFRVTMSLLPEAYQIESNMCFEAAALPIVLTLLSARFHLYRRNFSPACQVAERADALNICTSIAQDTAKYVSRALHNSPKLESKKTWQARVAPIGSNLVCLHLWRCILILAFRGDYDATLMCVHLSKAIGNVRKINMACGRYLVFFLEELQERIQTGATPQQLENDEEMMVYVSGDAQGSLENSWVWAGTDLSTSMSPPISPRHIRRTNGSDEPMRDTLPLRAVTDSLENGLDWNEWGRIEHLIKQLMETSRPRPKQPPTQPLTYYPPPHNPQKRVHLASGHDSPPKAPPRPSPAPSSMSRISIANII